jgi:hypothetical protein
MPLLVLLAMMLLLLLLLKLAVLLLSKLLLQQLAGLLLLLVVVVVVVLLLLRCSRLALLRCFCSNAFCFWRLLVLLLRLLCWLRVLYPVLLLSVDV